MRCDASVECPVLRLWSDAPFYVQSAGSTDDPPEAARHEVLRPRNVNEIAADVPIAPPPALRRNANDIAPYVPIAPPPEPTAPPLEKTASPPKWPPVPRGCIGHVRLSSQDQACIQKTRGGRSRLTSSSMPSTFGSCACWSSFEGPAREGERPARRGAARGKPWPRAGPGHSEGSL